MDVCLRVLKESNKSRLVSYSVRNSVLIISHITFQDCRMHIFSDKPLAFSKSGSIPDDSKDINAHTVSCQCPVTLKFKGICRTIFYLFKATCVQND